MDPAQFPNLHRAAVECAKFNDLPLDEVLEFMAGVAKLHRPEQVALADRFAGLLPDDVLTEFAAGDYAADGRNEFSKDKSLLKYRRGMTEAEWKTGFRVFDTLLDAAF